MTSQKPYLIRALYEWCTDNEFTPYLMTFVDANTLVPKQFVQNNQIVLNIAFNATKNLLIDNNWITFQASFSGQAMDISVPVANVLALFAKENGQGMQFELEPNQPTPPQEEEAKPQATGGLKFVK
jgi:stringent starvation protein B